MSKRASIVYYERLDELPEDADYIVTVSPGFDDKTEFLESLAKALEFPDYFGENWDAFNDCINDLSWIDCRQLLLIHEDVPLSGRDAAAYVDILREAQLGWAGAGALDLVVAFPASCREEIARLSKA